MNSRRSLLVGCGGALTGLAGCLQSPSPSASSSPPQSQSDGDPTVVTSLFPLYEFTSAIGGDRVSVENPVPVGAYGHEWEPPASLLPTLVEADAFVYFAAERFQPWAKAAAEQLQSAYADSVTLIDALEGIPLRRYATAKNRTVEALTVETVALVDPGTENTVADFHFDHWHGEIPDIPAGETVTLRVVVTDHSGDVISFTHSNVEFAVVFPDPSAAAFVSTSIDRDLVRFTATEAGETSVIFSLETADDRWQTPSIGITAGDGGAENRSDSSESTHTHGEFDAKFFADPVLAQQGVKTIRDALIDLDPAWEHQYRENADAYIDELASVHELYEETLQTRTRETVIVAGHDSFGYLADRYGFEIHTPVGLSADHEPTPAEIAETIELIEAEAIDCVLWDYFEGDRIASVIAAEADTVEERRMISPLESTTEGWNTDGRGSLLSQMTEINLPAFATALGAADPTAEH